MQSRLKNTSYARRRRRRLALDNRLTNYRNAGRLTRAWNYKIGKVRAEGITGGSELTPIVVNGMMYIATNNRVVALEPETGKEVWSYEMKNGEPTRRGIAFWPSDGNTPPRIFFTSGPRLIGLSA